MSKSSHRFRNLIPAVFLLLLLGVSLSLGAAAERTAVDLTRLMPAKDELPPKVYFWSPLIGGQRNSLLPKWLQTNPQVLTTAEDRAAALDRMARHLDVQRLRQAVLIKFQQPRINVFAFELGTEATAISWESIIRERAPIKVEDDPTGLLDYRALVARRGNYLLWLRFIQAERNDAEALEAIITRKLDALLSAKAK